jgi:hypothetical protein
MRFRQESQPISETEAIFGLEQKNPLRRWFLIFNLIYMIGGKPVFSFFPEKPTSLPGVLVFLNIGINYETTI